MAQFNICECKANIFTDTMSHCEVIRFLHTPDTSWKFSMATFECRLFSFSFVCGYYFVWCHCKKQTKKNKKKTEYFANEKQNKKCSSYEKTWRHYGKIVLRIVWADAQWQIKLDNTQLDPVLRWTSKSWKNLCDVWKTARSSAGKSIPTSWPGGNGAEKGKGKNKLWESCLS